MTAVNQAATLSPPRALPNARTRMILEAPVLPTLLALAAPNLVVMLAQALANFLESYYVGLLGVDALAGAALVFPLVMLMMMMSAGGIGGGISSAVARSLGAGDQDKADALALHAVVIVVAFGLICSVIVIGFAGPLYGALGGQGAIQGRGEIADWEAARLESQQVFASLPEGEQAGLGGHIESALGICLGG